MKTAYKTAELNYSQLQSVRFTEKPLLVLAGAGSGKTRVITHKVSYLIENNYPPHKILAITFTKRAANEMKERVFKYTGVESRWISTFHSFCLKIVRSFVKFLNNGLKPDFIVYDEDEAFKLFKKVCKDNYFDQDQALNLFKRISYLKQHGEINDSVFQDYRELKIYKTYESALIQCNAVDFDNIQLFAYKLLANPEISNYFKYMFDYILIDEFQDTSPIQYSIVKSITKNGNITAVGDPQQSIYGFRGAVVDNILKFINEFNPKIIKLEENYRSCKVVLHVANTVSELIDEKWKSLVVKLKNTKTDEGTVKIALHEDEHSEALWILNNVKALTESFSLSQIAILVRARYIKPAIKEVFARAGILLDDVDDYDFFKRTEVRDVLSYLKFAYNPSDYVSFERAITTPPRRIGEKTLKQIAELNETDYLKATKVYANTAKGNKRDALLSFVRFIEYLQGFLNDPAQALNIVVKTTSYVDYLKEKFKDDCEDRFASIKELFVLLKRYKSLKDFIDDTLLYNGNRSERQAVKLMTVHTAKGLEFDAVFLPSLERGIFPDVRCEFDEEVRCFYVAVTRAKKYLFLSACKTRERFGSRQGSAPGKFFDYIKNAYI
ncbi:ATP-dependent helicase [Thermodesulfovibrio sp. 3907-1M]|uniref:DNA 3'-5' helicase n=1 Tax=Thermodesulfovibrio autotrophicus TaxID=3118333 RepID=A0AAU8GZA2_9BACT